MACSALRALYSSPCRHPAATGGGVINLVEGQSAASLLAISSQQSQSTSAQASNVWELKFIFLIHAQMPVRVQY